MPLIRSTRRSTMRRSAGLRSSPVATAVLAARAGGTAGWSEGSTKTRIRAGMATAEGRNGCEPAFQQASVRAVEDPKKPPVSGGFFVVFLRVSPHAPGWENRRPLAGHRGDALLHDRLLRRLSWTPVPGA